MFAAAVMDVYVNGDMWHMVNADGLPIERSWLGYQFVELPCQQLGRRVIRRLRSA